VRVILLDQLSVHVRVDVYTSWKLEQTEHNASVDGRRELLASDRITQDSRLAGSSRTDQQCHSAVDVLVLLSDLCSDTPR